MNFLAFARLAFSCVEGDFCCFLKVQNLNAGHMLGQEPKCRSVSSWVRGLELGWVRGLGGGIYVEQQGKCLATREQDANKEESKEAGTEREE